MTVAPAISSQHSESSIPHARSSRAHAKAAQSEGSRSFAHVLREGLNKDKDESKDVPKNKKAAQQATDKDGLTSSSSSQGTTAPAKPLTGKFGLPNMLADSKPDDTKAVNAPPADLQEVDVRQLQIATDQSPSSGAEQTLTAQDDSAVASSNPPATGSPASTGSGPVQPRDGNALLMAMLTQSRLGDLKLGHGSKNEALLTGVDFANSPVLAPSLANLAVVQNAGSNPASATAKAGAQQSPEPSNNQSLPDATSSPDASSPVAPAALPGHLAFALRLSVGTLGGQSHGSSLTDSTGPAPITSGTAMPTGTPVVAVPNAPSDKEEERGSDAPPQHERSVPDAVLQPAAQASQNETPLPTNEVAVPAPVPELDDKFDDGSTEPVRNVHMQVIGEGNRRVNIALLDRSGALRVSVHSADTGLNQKLQEKMPELTSQLEREKYDTQVWMPRRNDSDSQNQENKQQQPRPDWVEELERKSGNEGRNQSTWLQ